jgi:hypothetical protein
MSFTKKDRKVRSDSGKTFPQDVAHETIGHFQFAKEIADALHREYGQTYAAVKKLAVLMGVNERAVKNWFGAKNGPNGEFLVGLMRYSEEVLECVLLLAGRGELVKAKKLVDARQKLGEMLALIDQIEGGSHDGEGGSGRTP